MDNTLFGSLTIAVGAVVAALVPALVQNVRMRKQLEQLGKQLGNVDASYQKLYKTYHDLLNKELHNVASQRLISFQLLAIDSHLCEDKIAGRYPIIEILGINSLGLLHQGRERVRNILENKKKEGYGGKIRILLLDPDSEAFRRRQVFEMDKVGRLEAELCASLYILADIRENVGSEAFASLEIRFHDSDPDRSLVMLDVSATDEAIVLANANGVILENQYPGLGGERGLENECHKWTLSCGKTYYKGDLEYFRNLWSKAKQIENEKLHKEALRIEVLMISKFIEGKV